MRQCIADVDYFAHLVTGVSGEFSKEIEFVAVGNDKRTEIGIADRQENQEREKDDKEEDHENVEEKPKETGKEEEEGVYNVIGRRDFAFQESRTKDKEIVVRWLALYVSNRMGGSVSVEVHDRYIERCHEHLKNMRYFIVRRATIYSLNANELEKRRIQI